MTNPTQLIEQLVGALKRYRTETPLGHQPYLIAETVDSVLSEARAHLEQPASTGGDREGFEEMLRTLPHFPKSPLDWTYQRDTLGNYCNNRVDDMWHGWAAARSHLEQPTEPAPSTAGERMEILSGMAREQLNGQTLVYDTESGRMQSVPKPATTKEARWVRVSEGGEGQENYCEECGAEPGNSCTDVDGREWGRCVHAIRQEEPVALLQSTALPVGELTDEQIDVVLGAAYLKLVKETGYTGGMGGETWDKAAARAILAAARPQPVLEPLTPEQLEREFCELVGLETGINSAAVDTKRALVWFKKGYRHGITQGGKV